MSNKKPNAVTIADYIFRELLEHQQDDGEQIYHKDRDFSYIDFYGEPITEDQAKEKILELVTADLDNNGKIFLYTCRDNALITIEDIPEEDMADENNEIYESFGNDQTDDVPTGLLIGYD